MVEHKSPAELQRQAREAVIAYRTREETKFNNWKKALLTCSKEEVLDKIPYDIQSMTFESLIPEIYKDRPNQAQYAKELKAANAILEECNNIIDELNREGAKLLEEYNKIK